LHLPATSASSPSKSRSPTGGTCRPRPSFRKRLALATRPFSISRIKSPSCSLLVFQERPGDSAASPGSHARRVWLPSQRVFQLFIPWKPLSAPDAPGLRLSELFSSPVIERRFPFSSPLLHSPTKPNDLISVLQRLHPTGKAVPLFAPRGFSSGRGLLLS